jgi:hypothetical protein
MSWAVIDHGARIVNLSLGSIDHPGTDPLEEAIDTMSARFGALFVVAAGNWGESGGPFIASPGSADAALTVGAVDGGDQIAWFSSYGPRLGDSAIKPDITAPGVDIAAARSSVISPYLGGEPVGTAYLRLSGTSMATPHVAGAAAILLQQHPDWTGAQLKAALTGSAAPNPTASVFQQGSGRVDLDRATRQQVVAEPSSLSLGYVRWPHGDDELQTRTVTYHNDSAAPVTLALSAALTGPGGVTGGATVAVEPAALTLPAGGSADVTVTVDSRGDGPDVLYAGALTATGADVLVRTPIAIEREVESYNLTLRGLDRAGDPAGFFTALSPAVQGGVPTRLFHLDGEAQLRLPRGTYLIHAYHSNPELGLMYPRFDLSSDQTLVMDGRLARPVDVKIAGVDLAVRSRSAVFRDRLVGVGTSLSTPGSLYTGRLGPDAPPSEVSSAIFVAAAPSGAPAPSHVIYGLAHREDGHMAAGWTQTIDPRQLSTVEADYSGDDGQFYLRGTSGLLDGFGSYMDTSLEYVGPFHRTEHYYGAGVSWSGFFNQMAPIPEFPDYHIEMSSLSEVREFAPGRTYVERWNRAPFGPAAPAAERTGDQLWLWASNMYSDNGTPRHSGTSGGIATREAMFKNGQLIAENEVGVPLLDVVVGPEPATYRYERSVERGPGLDGEPFFDLSTRVDAAWTFRSRHVPGDATRILPVPTLRFQPELDVHNRAPARAIVLPVAIERPEGAARPRISRVEIDASFDDGATWTRVPGALIGDRWIGIVRHPAGAAYASLRGTAVDVDGNRVDQTLIHAYRIAP